MPNKKEVIYHRGEFLNFPGHHTCANILASIVVTENEDYDGEKRLSSSILFTVGDCTRNISLDFDCYCLEELENSLNKIRKLNEVVSEFAAKMETDWGPKMRAYIKKKKKRKKNKKSS